MAVDPRLHPALDQLLAAQGWTDLSPIQDQAWERLAAGGHAVLVAPTGHGKTEAALLPILHRLLEARDDLQARGRVWPTGFKALYITPLRALNRDLMARLTSWAAGLELRIGVRHGDTSQAERARQSRDPPDLLITTPETVQLLLYGDRLRSHLATVRMVVVDEVHDLAASERGAQLLVALERIEEVIAQPDALRTAKAKDRHCPQAADAMHDGFQRIGLSATVAEPASMARYLGGKRDVAAIVAHARKERHLEVIHPEPDEEDGRLAATLSIPPAAVAQMRAVRRLVAAHDRVLVFHNTRHGAELLASRSHLLDGDDDRLLDVHHGSLAVDHRVQVEQDFKDGRLRGLVATGSMELGIDVGAVDHVVQIGSPCNVARLVQRLGRAGHRIGAVSEGTLISTGAEDHLECLAVARAAETGRLEPLRIRDAPLVVLANQLVALSNEYQHLDLEWTWQVVTRASVFADLDRGLFEQTWETLLDVQTVFEADDAPGRLSRSGRGRRHFLSHVSLIPDERTYRILDEASKRSVGTVDDAFVAADLHVGASFIMAGRSWRVLNVDAERALVRVAPANDVGALAQWSGDRLPVSLELARAAAARRTGDDLGPAADAARAQKEAGLEVPDDQVATLEIGKRMAILNVPLGTRGNEALGRLLQALLHQRRDTPVTMQHDAYRIQFQADPGLRAEEIQQAMDQLEPEDLDLVLAHILRHTPVVRFHLVHVAKQFGALPVDLDPKRFTKAKQEALWDRLALQEETLSRLVHDRLDLEAVAGFLRDLRADRIRLVVQAIGPISRLGVDAVRRHLAPRSDDALLAEVRRRIEETEVRMACTDCGHVRDEVVRDLSRRLHCRRCQSIHIACLRPWDHERIALLARKDRLGREQRREVDRMRRNATLVASFGPTACRTLVGRGVGPDVAARILQKVADPSSPAFWRQIIEAELEFARTSGYWKRPQS